MPHRSTSIAFPRPYALALAHAKSRTRPQRHDPRARLAAVETRTKASHLANGVSMPRRRRQPGLAGDRLFTSHAVPAEPMEIDPNLRTRSSDCTRMFTAPDQDLEPCCPAPKHAAMLFWALLASGQDHHAQVRRMQTPRRPKPRRSNHRPRRMIVIASMSPEDAPSQFQHKSRRGPHTTVAA